jgi:hypothetical protein
MIVSLSLNADTCSFARDTYCSHEEVLAYLRSYAAHFDVLGYVRFSTTVSNVVPTFDDRNRVRHWTVESRDANGRLNTERFDAVVVCNGHYSEPRVPSYDGQDAFRGTQMHSHNYRRPEGFVGKRIIVVGAAFSGSDISQELVDHGAGAVFLSGRNWEDVASRAEGSSTAEVIKVPDVRRLVPGTKSVEFVDGQVVEDVDVVMYATGYVYKFPFFDESVDCRIEDNRIDDLYKHVFFPKLAPTLSLIGIPWKVVPFPLFQLQARWVGKSLSGEIELPSEEAMRKDVEASYEALGDLPKRYTHRFDAESQGEYAKWLGRQCGEEATAWPDWRRDLYVVSGRNRRENGIDFREVDLRAYGAKEAYEAFEEEAEALRRR